MREFVYVFTMAHKFKQVSPNSRVPCCTEKRKLTMIYCARRAYMCMLSFCLLTIFFSFSLIPKLTMKKAILIFHMKCILQKFFPATKNYFVINV